jgi:diguanylate cyclase (GGDEF)-like protein
MLAATSFQAPPITQADSGAAQAGDREPGAPLPRTSRNDELASGQGSPLAKVLRANALKAAVTLLTSENRTLQESLEEERKFCAELRLALEKQRQAASTDPLTGLYNRRAMDHHLDELWSEPVDGPLAILMLDIDYFKRINDTYGHLTGDRALCQVAATLCRCIRSDDYAFRYGGEEFLVLLPNTSLDGAISLAESIRGRIAALHLTVPRNWHVPITVSLGVATRKDQDDPSSLFDRADRALYAAKHRGRNQVVHEGALA